ncbi:MAG: acetate uptake transporter [Candidatus Dormibacterales bacterium]
MAEERAAPALGLAVADPAPLGLGAFALTTFVLSAHNAGWAPDLIWVGLALFYGGMAQFLAGMWEFKNKNTFGSTAFASYGGFWLSLGGFVVLVLFGKIPASVSITHALAWFLVAFAIFNSYMLIASTRVNLAVFGVFLTLEVTEILLFIGNFQNQAAGQGLVQIGGIVGVITALVAWYASFAGVVNSMSPTRVLPVGGPMWGASPIAPRAGSPLPRTQS